MTTQSVVPPVSAEMRDAALTLAAQIESGFFCDLTEDQRCDLRGLPMAMVGWADRVETMENERDDARRSAHRRDVGLSVLRAIGASDAEDDAMSPEKVSPEHVMALLNWPHPLPPVAYSVVGCLGVPSR